MATCGFLDTVTHFDVLSRSLAHACLALVLCFLIIHTQTSVGPCIDIQGSVWPQVLESVRQLFSHVSKKLNPRHLTHSFELLGLDFMIDKNGQVMNGKVLH
jgi:hypothetical protein